VATVDAPANRLVWPILALTSVAWFHDLDHVRQVRDVEPGVALLGVLGIVGTLLALALSIARHVLAPLASILVGFGTAIGFFAVHVLPDWGPLSDGYPDLPVDVTSWIAAVVPILVGAWVGVAGLRAARERGISVGRS